MRLLSSIPSILCTSTLFALFVANLSISAAETFALPPTWNGSTVGQTAGNPAMGTFAGKSVAMWRLDRVLNDKPEVGTNFEPMAWSPVLGGMWYPTTKAVPWEPRAQLKDGGVLEFAMRQSWASEGDAAGEKIPVLVFIAPTDGIYTFSTDLESKKLGGGGGLFWSLYLRDPKHLESTTKITDEDLGKATDVVKTLNRSKITLKSGEELAFILRSDGFQTLFLMHLSKISVTLQ